MNIFRVMFKNDKGATAIEYGLIAALISVAAITAMGTLSSGIQSTFNKAGTEMTNAAN